MAGDGWFTGSSAGEDSMDGESGLGGGESGPAHYITTEQKVSKIQVNQHIFRRGDMGDRRLPPLMEYFSEAEDPGRETKNKKYPLIEVIVIAFLAVMSGADGWEPIERCGVMREKWLCKFLVLEEGIPKHDVYRRVLGAIRSELLESCFMNWVRDIKQDIQREVIAIDGKTMRGMAANSRFKAGTEAKSIHMVSARATENQLVFAQVQTEAKSSEITAIPILLEQIAIAGCIITIDAMGCQYEIADKIVKKGADYVFSLKGSENRTAVFYFQSRRGRGIVRPRGPVALGNRKPAALYA
jgi:predicted transposase YbfD/YdcC